MMYNFIFKPLVDFFMIKLINVTIFIEVTNILVLFVILSL